MIRSFKYAVKFNRSSAAVFQYIQRRAVSSTGSLWRYRDDVTITESYYHGSSHIPLLGKTIGVALQETADKFPDRDAFVYGTGGKRHTYRQLLDEVDRLAAGFLKIGITKGDRVGMMGPNIEEWVLTQYATARIGAILVNVNPAYRPHELEYALNKVGMKAIVAPQSYKTQDYYGMLSGISHELKSSKPGHLHCERLPDLKSVIIAGEDKLSGTFTFDDVRTMGGDKRHDIEELGRDFSFDEPINIQFTSGTTGLPKGTMLTHHNIVNNAYFMGLVCDYGKEHQITVCQTFPLYHCAGTVCGSLSQVIFGATVVLPAPGHDPQKILQAIQNERCTDFCGTPTIYLDTLNQPNFQEYDISSLRRGGIGGSPCPTELLKVMKYKMNVSPVVSFGMTESSPVTTSTKLGDSDDLILHTAGRALDHIEIKVIDPETQKSVPVNMQGELCIRGYNVMRGYWDDPERTAETIDEEGWLHSGDLAVMRENGYTSIVGRIKDMIIRGGSNIFPAEIENFLHQHPKITNVQVVGVPDARMGEEICACIQLKDDETATPEEINEFCEGEISHNKIPRYVEFVDSYPLTATMKVQKIELSRIMTEKLGL